MTIKDILKKEIDRISLSREQILNLESVAGDFIKLLKREGFKVHIGGSLAKGTVVQKEGRQDVDIFVVFNYSEDIFKLEGALKRIDLPGKLKKVHGSRDYFQIVCKDVLLEIIPVVKNNDPELAENITDISLSHVKYIAGEIEKNPEIADEIKLAKVFCRAQRCYGAESYIKGFSGYSLEVLVIYFGGFVKFLRGIVKCKTKKVIDPLKYFKSEREVLTELNESKLNGPIILVDPTYKYRNISAGLGMESFEKFVESAKKFLRLPLATFFERQEIDIKKMKDFALAKKAKFVEINLGTDRQEGDIAGTKMKKILDFFERELVRKQQKVLQKEFDYDNVGQKAKGYLVVEEKEKIELRGPPSGLDDAVKAFKKAKNKVSKKKGYYWYKEKSGIREVLRLVKKVEKEMGAGIEI